MRMNQLARIEVTQDHIDRGIKQDCHNCPVALAFQDAGFSDAEVNNWEVSLTVEYDRAAGGIPGKFHPAEMRITKVLPEFIQDLVRNFDILGKEGLSLIPQTFPIAFDFTP